ncbi:HDOD domain-containing protein [Marinimicrobium sp. ABcell2]|uniref:HDOD domain-containing protein n=1 Tax=Marinimicrobium sp. ABcell2 TaxID=3069751 RepID=UPI0027B02F3B|nr:HDOD domain-containing protein [Marinimicrobium sp. ABcell2]MDQ2077072.1 HDOD domain-containing protein [Marinimicrobium sp. ABcell2]
MKEQAQELLRILQRDLAAHNTLLPSLPEVALRVRLLTSDPDCNIAQLEQEVAKDAVIAARLVKVANSASLLRGNPVTSLRQAIANLGLNLVRSLVTQLAILQTMQRRGDSPHMRDFVDVGLRISALCHTLASHQTHLDPELASLGGLLHNIGKLPLREFLGKRPELTLAERNTLEQLLHPAVGAMMLRRWQMAEPLVQMAREHEKILRESGSPKADYVDIVIAANLLHYGTDTGRYARYAKMRIPALEKCTRQLDKDGLQKSAEQRMELALSLT